MTPRKRKKGQRLPPDERQVELLPDAGTRRAEVPTPEPPEAPNSVMDGEEPVAVARDAKEPAPAARDGKESAAAPEPKADRSSARQPEVAPVPSPPQVSKAPVSDSVVRPAGNQLARARDLVERGRVNEAIELYREIVAENPASLKAHNNLGVLFDEVGKFEAAVEHFEEALRLEPDNVEVLTNHGSALTALARYEVADAMLRRALRNAPDDVAARLAAGILSFRRGLYAQADVELRWVCEHDAENGPAFYYRGEALNRSGGFDEAIPLVERAAQLMPGDPRPFYTLGHLYDRKSLSTEAAEMYRRVRELQTP
ncbi:MAG: tetratricopeptide repeat protein [Gemmatimonadetes bacterium]|nr:tetratricopeptide repeat protein [Gemmatimonadota bacterium]MDA1104167.1 tetratricopeptide repeat protein [Gemmatimonadota bacterium]